MRLALTFIVALLMAGTAMAVSTAPANATAANRTQAVRKAKEYLAYEAFSLKSLIHQLKYEGFDERCDLRRFTCGRELDEAGCQEGEGVPGV